LEASALPNSVPTTPLPPNVGYNTIPIFIGH
jgi:hypothetical protein